MSDEAEKLPNSLEEAIVNPDLVDLGKELGELSVDSLLEAGLLKDLPVIGTITALGKTALNIRDYLFLKKIVAFLSSLNGISSEKRQAMIKEIDDSKEFQTKVGEKLLYIIDHADDDKSAQVIGLLFKAFLEGRLTYKEFLRSAQIVNVVFFNDLVAFVNHERNSYWDNPELQDSLTNSGLFDIEIDPVEVEVTDSKKLGKPVVSRMGEKVYETDVNGGELSFNISKIGKTIKEVLKGSI